MAKRETYGPGSILHVYNRGAGKANIFGGGADYDRFLATAYLVNSTTVVPPSLLGKARNIAEAATFCRGETLVDIFAYALMPNHFHLKMRERVAGGVTRYMRRLGTAHTMYMNRKYARSGCLFQGAFKLKVVGEPGYFDHLDGYVHANPIDLMPESAAVNPEKVHDFLASYQYSSYQDFAGAARVEREILCPEALARGEAPERFVDRVVAVAMARKVRP